MGSLIKVKLRDGQIVGLDPLIAAKTVRAGKGSFLGDGIAIAKTAHGEMAIAGDAADEAETATAPKAERATAKPRGGKGK